MTDEKGNFNLKLGAEIQRNDSLIISLREELDEVAITLQWLESDKATADCKVFQFRQESFFFRGYIQETRQWTAGNLILEV